LFGFDQVVDSALVFHPLCLVGVIPRETYKARKRYRAQLSYKAMSELLIKNNLVKLKEHPLYSLEREDEAFLEILTRVSPDPKTESYVFTVKLVEETLTDSKLLTSVLTNRCENELISRGVRAGRCQDIVAYPPASSRSFLTGRLLLYLVSSAAQPLPPLSFIRERRWLQTCWNSSD
jgi:fatty acid synthase subunit alpha, fungi type